MYLNTSQRPSGAFLQGPHLGEPSFEPKPSLHRASSLAQKGAEAREKDLAAGTVQTSSLAAEDRKLRLAVTFATTKSKPIGLKLPFRGCICHLCRICYDMYMTQRAISILGLLLFPGLAPKSAKSLLHGPLTNVMCTAQCCSDGVG